jgi:D-alanyl-D-alanine endopeptidase (penicillin-binding protein 7)
MSTLMLSVVHALGIALVTFVWQGAILGLFTAAILTLLRNARPQTRYAFACVALTLCAALPLGTLIANFGSAEDIEISAVALDALHDIATTVAGIAIMSAWVQAHLTAIVAAWAICVSLLGARMVYGLMWVTRISSASRSFGNSQWQTRVDILAARIGIARDISLRVVQGLDTPATVGWWRPVIMLPAALLFGMPPDLLEALLAHEIAHVRRFDYVVNLMQSVVEATLFYHPAVWWISHRMRIEREQIADDLAAGILGEPRRLALALRELEHIQFTNHHLAQAAHGGNLMVRIKRLVRPETQALDWKAAIPAVGFVIAGIAFCANAALADTAPAASASIAASTQTTSPSLFDANACKPQYPQESLNRLEEGSVEISFKVGANGKLLHSHVTQSSGHPLLDNAALTGLQACTFKAGTKNGKPVTSTLDIQYVWKIGN